MAELNAGPTALVVLARDQRHGVARGMPSLCSAHPFVLRTAFEHARERNQPVLVESTSNQVNQDGGYTGLRPADFVERVGRIADEAGLRRGRVILGGDHLGPYPWRTLPARAALERAQEMVAAYVRAGYAKIHLDASAACADDPAALPDAVVAERTATLAVAAEAAREGLASEPPVYVIGTEVPPPGGQQDGHAGQPVVTRPEDAARSLALTRAAFARHGLQRAWERVLAQVVQPGVEFGDDSVHRYRPEDAAGLRRLAESGEGLLYEAHSTDYQDARALRGLVADHFALLKVGPELTFAYREAVFALEGIERELFGGRAGGGLSGVRQALDGAMREDPRHWKGFFEGDEEALRLARAFSLSDRARYYWTQPGVAAAVSRLFASLEGRRLPAGLVSQYLPQAGEDAHDASAAGLAGLHVRRVLDRFARACNEEPAGSFGADGVPLR